jgi:hypothetical protein
MGDTIVYKRVNAGTADNVPGRSGYPGNLFKLVIGRRFSHPPIGGPCLAPAEAAWCVEPRHRGREDVAAAKA